MRRNLDLVPSDTTEHELREVRARIAAAKERRDRAQACAREIMDGDRYRERYSHLDATIRENRLTDTILKFL